MWSGRARKSLTGVLIGVGAAHARLLSIAGFLDGPPSAVARCRLASHNWFFKRSQRRPCAYTHTAPLSHSRLFVSVCLLSPRSFFFFFFTVLSYNRQSPHESNSSTLLGDRRLSEKVWPSPTPSSSNSIDPRRDPRDRPSFRAIFPFAFSFRLLPCFLGGRRGFRP